ncbi:hypothetical protein [Sphingomonas sp.]
MLDPENEATPADHTAGATSEVALKLDLDAAPSLQTEPDTMAEAMRCFAPDGDLQLASIDADEQRPPRFHQVAGDFAAAVAWAERENRDGGNIYLQPNRVRPGLNTKAGLPDIVSARFCQVDVDPPKDGTVFDKDAAVAALCALPVPPSFINSTGGGVQAFWRLSEPSHG